MTNPKLTGRALEIARMPAFPAHGLNQEFLDHVRAVAGKDHAAGFTHKMHQRYAGTTFHQQATKDFMAQYVRHPENETLGGECDEHNLAHDAVTDADALCIALADWEARHDD
jgi:hypothetical protein